MNTRPISTSTASVSGSRMMIVLAAEKPGIAPTTRPSRMAGRITHQKVSVCASSEAKSSASISEHGSDQPFERPFGKVCLNGTQTTKIAPERGPARSREEQEGPPPAIQDQHDGGQQG